jgi:aryl sulfotransferase
MAGAALARSRRQGEGRVTRTIWLASYPKSGNTWMRLLIANASNNVGEPVDINKIADGGMAADRGSFDYAALIDSGLLTHEEIDWLRPRIHAKFARGDFDHEPTLAEPRVQFVKVHDANTLNSAGEPLLGGTRGADGAIVIVRDPRDVAPSLADHLNSSIDEVITFMNDDDAALAKKTSRQRPQLRQRLRAWSGHVASWLDHSDIPVHLIRYEDLQKDARGVLRAALAFAGLPATEEKIGRAVAFSGFAQLQQQEQKGGFAETPPWKGARFFRRGEAGSWRDELSREQVARIESHHGQMMRRLGYELSHESNLACAG